MARHGWRSRRHDRGHHDAADDHSGAAHQCYLILAQESVRIIEAVLIGGASVKDDVLSKASAADARHSVVALEEQLLIDRE